MAMLCIFTGDIAAGCKLLRNRFESKDREWASYTCVLGFHVMGEKKSTSFLSKAVVASKRDADDCWLPGVWLEGSDGTDINALCRSHSQRLVAVADDFCKVHLFQYPCPKPKVPPVHITQSLSVNVPSLVDRFDTMILWGNSLSCDSSRDAFLSSPGTKPQIWRPRQPCHQCVLHPQWLPSPFHGRERHLHPSVEGDGSGGGGQHGEAGLSLFHLHQFSGACHQLEEPQKRGVTNRGRNVYTEPETGVGQWTGSSRSYPLWCHCCQISDKNAEESSPGGNVYIKVRFYTSQIL